MVLNNIEATIKSIGGRRLVSNKFFLAEQDVVVVEKSGSELFFQLSENRKRNELLEFSKQNLKVGDSVKVSLKLFSKQGKLSGRYYTGLKFLKIEKNDKMHSKEIEEDK